MKRFLTYTGLFLLPFFIAVLVLWKVSYPRKFAYNYVEGSCFNRGQFVYDRLFESGRPIDIAFVGTSHTMNAINDSLIEREISNTGTSLRYVANISYCWEGLNGQYVIIKDLVEQKSPKIIVLEVRENEKKINHEVFPYICDTHDALSQPYFSNAACLINLYKSSIARFDLLNNGRKYLSVPPDTTMHFGHITNNDIPKPETLENERVVQWMNFGLKGRLLDDHISDFSKFYFDRIVGLCKEKGIALYFLYLPGYGDILNEPLDAELYRNTGTLVIAPEEIRRDAGNWANTSHMNARGGNALSEWVGDYFKEHVIN